MIDLAAATPNRYIRHYGEYKKAPGTVPHVGVVDEYGDFTSLCNELVIPKYADEYIERNGLTGSVRPFIENRSKFSITSGDASLVHDIMIRTDACAECGHLYSTMLNIEKMHR